MILPRMPLVTECVKLQRLSAYMWIISIELFFSLDFITLNSIRKACDRFEKESRLKHKTMSNHFERELRLHKGTHLVLSIIDLDCETSLNAKALIRKSSTPYVM